MQKADIENKLELCIESFKSVLYEKDETFLENMAKSNMDQGNLARYMLREWTYHGQDQSPPLRSAEDFCADG